MFILQLLPRKEEAPTKSSAVAPDVYEKTKLTLTENFRPNININVERLKFRNSLPGLGDSHLQYMEKLKEKAKHCGFGNGYR